MVTTERSSTGNLRKNRLTFPKLNGKVAGMFGIFNKLGGETPTLDVIQRRRGFRPKHRAVQEWIWERKVPAINQAHLVEECMERGIPVDFSDFHLPKVLPPRAKSFPRRKVRVHEPT
jgi:hypothetical protein